MVSCIPKIVFTTHKKNTTQVYRRNAQGTIKPHRVRCHSPSRHREPLNKPCQKSAAVASVFKAHGLDLSRVLGSEIRVKGFRGLGFRVKGFRV